MANSYKRNGHIEVKGARENNLKNIDVKIPRNKFTVITGLSGSGKSSLALDTIYKEGLHRYIDCLSTYARQFLNRVEKPEVDQIYGLPTPIAIESRNSVKNSRSTVGTTTEIYDYLRLLYEKIGKIYCPDCNEEIIQHSPQTITNLLLKDFENERLIVAFNPTDVVSIENYMKKGYSKVLVNNQTIMDIEEYENDNSDKPEIIVDRLVIKNSEKSRITEAIETAFYENSEINLNINKSTRLNYTKELKCNKCNIFFRPPSTNLFSFNSPYGACDQCNGFGNNLEPDPDLIVPNSNLSLKEGAVESFAKPSYKEQMDKLLSFADDAGIDTNIPFSQLNKKDIDMIFNGNKTYYGIKKFFKRMERKKYKMYVRVFLNKYRSAIKCGKCNGSRLKNDALNIKVNNKNIYELSTLPISKFADFFSNLKLNEFELKVADNILKEITSRTEFLIQVGLDYLTLSRLTRSLSGGEAQRINLACQLGSRLTETLYILDEPSIGLHSRDIDQLIKLIVELKSRDNTVILIEHDLDTIKKADYIVELGPLSGDGGGQIVFEGKKERLLKSKVNSITKDYLLGRKHIELPERRSHNGGGSLKILKATENNLKNIDVEIPLEKFVCVTGVSGSGKSSLIKDVLYCGLARKFNSKVERIGEHKEILGIENIKDVIILDQSSIGKSSRSNPVTYIKVYDEIRKVLANSPQAKLRNLTPSHFSFNVEGGRCKKCKGDGNLTVEMHFLADVQIVCEECNGMKFNSEVLKYRYKNKNIYEILNLSVDSAILFFSETPSIVRKLKVLRDVGLDYIKLGQTANTLSGGEAQRIKIARELSKKEGTKILYILDEPTIGLHIDDIQKLLKVINKLVDKGNTVIMIEHNMEVIKCADHIIDMGPEGGEKGGRIMATGTPEEIIKKKNSHTGKYLRNYLNV